MGVNQNVNRHRQYSANILLNTSLAGKIIKIPYIGKYRYMGSIGYCLLQSLVSIEKLNGKCEILTLPNLKKTRLENVTIVRKILQIYPIFKLILSKATNGMAN